jgi:hypothetical protein
MICLQWSSAHPERCGENKFANLKMVGKSPVANRSYGLTNPSVWFSRRSCCGATALCDILAGETVCENPPRTKPALASDDFSGGELNRRTLDLSTVPLRPAACRLIAPSIHHQNAPFHRLTNSSRRPPSEGEACGFLTIFSTVKICGCREGSGYSLETQSTGDPHSRLAAAGRGDDSVPGLSNGPRIGW